VKAIYIDTSTFLRACLADANDHLPAFGLLNNAGKPLVSSELLWLEADRAAIRLARQKPDLATLPQQVTAALMRVGMIPITRAIINEARQNNQIVKSLDAIHIATAESLGAEIKHVVTYDKTMTAVLRERGSNPVTASEAVNA